MVQVLSDEDIINYKTISNNSLNLVIKENVLNAGEMYSFQLIVTQYIVNNKNSNQKYIIGYGVSKSTDIYVINEPIIISGSFSITPDCNYEYKTISELLNTSYSITLSENNEYGILSYQFGYVEKNKINYFHSSVLYELYIVKN